MSCCVAESDKQLDFGCNFVEGKAFQCKKDEWNCFRKSLLQSMDFMGAKFEHSLVETENWMASLVGKNQQLVAKVLVMRMTTGYK